MESLVNAGLKTKKEAINRLINGKSFYDEDNNRIFFSERHAHPFRCGVMPLSAESMHGIKKWQIKKEPPAWYENIGAGVLAFVWSSNPDAAVPGVVTNYYPKTGCFGVGIYLYLNARPMTPTESLAFIHGIK